MDVRAGLKLRAGLFAAAALAASLSPWPAAAQPTNSALPAPSLEAAPMPSLAPMVKRASPAVVNIKTSGAGKDQAGRRNPLLDDPFFRRFFDVPPQPQAIQPLS